MVFISKFCAVAVLLAAASPYHVVLPSHIRPLPEGSDNPRVKPGFAIRGMKGWAWSPEQYLEEIPVMAKYRMNFLMNCYSSLWDLGEDGRWVSDRKMNFWYRPLAGARKRAFEKVVRSAREHGLQFCFSINPNLHSDRPFDYNSPADFERLWSYYDWQQSLGVRWFNLSLDDIGERIDADGQARLLNRLLARLRQKDPGAQLVFCPTWYAGTGEAATETAHRLGRGDTPGRRYTRILAERLHPDIYLFWTGAEVGPLAITAQDVLKYRALAGHRIIIWDNYPVNDQHPALHLGPLTGRDPGLPEVVAGYIGNPMGFQNEANRLPMLTIADYLWNPAAYNPERSIGQAILHLGDTAGQREALRELVELYPGRLHDGSLATNWNSLRERYGQLTRSGSRTEAERLAAGASRTARNLRHAFPGKFQATLAVLDADIRAMGAEP